MDPLSIFLDPSPSDSPLWEFSPPGPAVYRREWCRLEEKGAVEYRDPLAPRTGRHRMEVKDVSRGPESVWLTLLGVGGRRLRVPVPHSDGSSVPLRGATVEVEIRPRAAQHWVTPAGLHLVGPGGGWTVHRSAAEAETKAGQAEIEVLIPRR